MAFTEINTDEYDVQAIEHQMGRTSLMRFTKISELGDDDELPVRTNVRYTVDGAVWFAGKTLPVKRSIGPGGQEVIEYVAADITEFLARNPCDEVNRYYNRNQSDSNIYPYPSGKSVQFIVDAEFDSIVGSGKLIGGIDWALAGTGKDIVPLDFETRGKTWLQILDALVAEVPTLAWWYDPSDGLNSNEVTGGTIRFYDLSVVPGSPQDVWLPDKSNDTLDEDDRVIESIDIDEDISSSYDTLVLFGWGDCVEEYEKVVPAFNASGVEFNVVLRQNTNNVQQLSTIGSGSWVNPDSNNLGRKGWHPGSKRLDAQWLYRRFQVTKEIIDLRLRLDTTVTPNVVVRESQSMWVETLNYVYNTGPLTFTLNSAVYVGALLSGVKVQVPYTGNQDDDSGNEITDFGTVVPNPSMYPSYPTDTEPRVQLGTPAEYEGKYFTLASPLIHRSDFVFSANLSGSVPYNLLINQPVFKYRVMGNDVWLRYTSKEEFKVTLTDGSLGYGKKIHLWDQRFLKYTDKDGTVVRDDTATMTDYATTMFALMKRRRVYGSLAVHLPDTDDAINAIPMGASIRIRNWKGSTNKTLDARVQSVNLTDTRHRHALKLGFDSPSTFTAIEKAARFRAWFRANEINGTGGASGAGGGQSPGAGGGTDPGSGGEGGEGAGGGGGGCGCGGPGTGPGGGTGGSGGGGGPPGPPPPPPPPPAYDCTHCPQGVGIGDPPPSNGNRFTGVGGPGCARCSTACVFFSCPGETGCCITNEDGNTLQGCCVTYSDGFIAGTVCCYNFWQQD